MVCRAGLVVFVALLLTFSLSAQNSPKEDLYQYDSLTLQLDLKGSFTLEPTSSTARVRDVTAQLFLYPLEDVRQQTLDWNSAGLVQDGKVKFSWKDSTLGTKEFGYTASIKTVNKRPEVKMKIPFPLSEVTGYEEYLQPTKTIDSTHPQVVAKAAELAEGETDLFAVAFKVAHWVDENVRYDLTTLTKDTSQKASWVLEHKEGVCDEMTSLFVAMMRSLGVPARFVSGVSYTTSDLFSEPWQPHGWAEVYFPGVGWVPFDITFGEYGYIDGTHITLRDGFDPAEPATKYEWIADSVDLDARDLKLNVLVQKKGKLITEEVQVEEEILSPDIGFGSYNLIKGILKNTADYYAASTLQLAVPKEVELMGRNKRTILLGPREVKETYWVVHIPETLNSKYQYTFPARIYSEKNLSVEDSFGSKEGDIIYSRLDVEKLTVKDEDKSYSRKVSFDCDVPAELALGSRHEASCTIKNSGNTNLKQLAFCLGGVCETFDLPINQKKVITVTLEGKQAGKQKLVVSAENDLIDKKQSLEYTVVDQPLVEIVPHFPAKVRFGESVTGTLLFRKKSFAVPYGIVAVVETAGLVNQWELEQLSHEQQLSLELDSRKMAHLNAVRIAVGWVDADGRKFSTTQELQIEVESDAFKDRLKMFFNWIKNRVG